MRAAVAPYGVACAVTLRVTFGKLPTISSVGIQRMPFGARIFFGARVR